MCMIKENRQKKKQTNTNKYEELIVAEHNTFIKANVWACICVYVCTIQTCTLFVQIWNCIFLVKQMQNEMIAKQLVVDLALLLFIFDNFVLLFRLLSTSLISPSPTVYVIVHCTSVISVGSDKDIYIYIFICRRIILSKCELFM